MPTRLVRRRRYGCVPDVAGCSDTDDADGNGETTITSIDPDDGAADAGDTAIDTTATTRSSTTSSDPTTTASEPTTTTTEPAGPATTFGGGTHLVGTDVAPGTYRTTVDSFGCYWERTSATTGEFGAILANDNVEPGSQAIVTIASTDHAFSLSGCGPWRAG